MVCGRRRSRREDRSLNPFQMCIRDSTGAGPAAGAAVPGGCRFYRREQRGARDRCRGGGTGVPAVLAERRDCLLYTSLDDPNRLAEQIIAPGDRPLIGQLRHYAGGRDGLSLIHI